MRISSKEKEFNPLPLPQLLVEIHEQFEFWTNKKTKLGMEGPWIRLGRQHVWSVSWNSGQQPLMHCNFLEFLRSSLLIYIAVQLPKCLSLQQGLPAFVKLLEGSRTHWSFVYGCFCVTTGSWVVATEALWLTKLKVFTIYLFKKKKDCSKVSIFLILFHWNSIDVPVSKMFLAYPRAIWASED